MKTTTDAALRNFVTKAAAVVAGRMANETDRAVYLESVEAGGSPMLHQLGLAVIELARVSIISGYEGQVADIEQLKSDVYALAAGHGLPPREAPAPLHLLSDSETRPTGDAIPGVPEMLKMFRDVMATQRRDRQVSDVVDIAAALIGAPGFAIETAAAVAATAGQIYDALVREVNAHNVKEF